MRRGYRKTSRRHGLPIEERFWPRVDKSGDCWLWTGRRDKLGYGRLDINRIGRLTHRIAWELTNGPIPEGLFACHHCDNPPCVNPAHLFLGDWGDNARDRNSKGRNASTTGENNGRAKLTETQVREIRALRQKGLLQREVGALYGLPQEAISAIERGRRWGHVPQ